MMKTDILSPVHRAYLNEHAVCDEVIGSAGIFSNGDEIIFPWADGEQVTAQRRRWPEPEGGPGDFKYLWEPGRPLHLWAIRPMDQDRPDEPVILAEGTKQALAVASWAPGGYAVYGMAGCRGWANTDLSRFAGRQVVIMLDADAGANLDVYEAGEKLASLLELEDAVPGFVPSPAWGKDGIDDYLGTVAAERRTERIAKIIARAGPKPAERRPAARRPAAQPPESHGLPPVAVNQDRRLVVHDILHHMKQAWDGRAMFCFGDVLTRLRVAYGPDGQVLSALTEPMTRDSLARWMCEVVYTGKHITGTLTTPDRWEACWPESQTMGALLASEEEWARLDRLSRTPFIRPDGSVCAKNGYDPDTRTMLITGNSGMDRLDIPGSPSAGDAAAAAAYLLGSSWLGDMPWRDGASRANALALTLTPFIRGVVPLVPLAVISGLQPGVGKNLLADCISILATGEAQPPLPWLADDDDENRKQITSAFRAGQGLMIFDEAHMLGGSALTRALTSITYADRILGMSKQAAFPNKATWIALGNQVTVNADMARRAYFIDLWPDVPDPESRPESVFRIHDLRGWTAGNRPELITAALTIIRAWYSAGQPAHHRGSLMGSFEAWDKLMSGILAYAGVDGFLSNLAGRRSEQDTTGGYWAEHLAWLKLVFGGSEFTCLDVRVKAMASAGTWDAPPRLTDPGHEGWTRDLGQAYSRQADRWYGNLRVHKAGIGHGSKVRWVIQELGGGVATEAVQAIHPIPPTHPSGSTQPELPGRDRMDQIQGTNPANRAFEGTRGVEGSDALEGYLPHSNDVRAHASARAHTRAHEEGGRGNPSRTSDPSALDLSFDLETDDADRMFLIPRGQLPEDGGFVRLAGITGPSGAKTIIPVPDLVALLGAAGTVAGHNIMGMDGLALAWHHGMGWPSFAARARDTELIARQVFPPRSRESGTSADRLGLDAVAERLGLPGKTDDLARLKNKHGGYGKIPLDDPEYLAYLEGDLDATREVARQLLPYYDADPYLAREHKLAEIAGHITMNGFRVDVPLLEQRLGEVRAAKDRAQQDLHDGWGLPLSRQVMRGRGKARHEETEEFGSPIATDEGKAWLASQFERYGVADPPRTAKTRELATGADELKPLMDDPACPDGLRGMLALMAVATGARTIYQTTADYLAPDGRIHPKVSMRQASGRWSFTKPGLTVFGKHGGRHREREILLPDEGHVLLSFDLSQVDMRAMAGHSQDPAYMAMFAPGQDAHAMIAEQVGLSRQNSKAVGHGWNYGLGPARMIRNGMDPEVVHRFVTGMEARFTRLIAWREEIRAMARAGMILDNGFGRRMLAEPSRAYTVGPALMGQGGARDIMCQCLLNLPRELYPFLRGMIHDEILLSVPAELWRDIRPIVENAMTWTWRGVPILCDFSGPGQNWGEVSSK